MDGSNEFITGRSLVLIEQDPPVVGGFDEFLSDEILVIGEDSSFIVVSERQNGRIICSSCWSIRYRNSLDSLT